MAREVLVENYPRQQTFDLASSQFAERLNSFFGGCLLIEEQKILSENEMERKEYLEFSNGMQLNMIFTRSHSTFEVTASAYHVFNDNYLQQHISEEDIDYLCDLLTKEELFSIFCNVATQRLLSLTEIPGTSFVLSSEEKLEAEQLSYLVPKLMIITGRAQEKNFI